MNITRRIIVAMVALLLVTTLAFAGGSQEGEGDRPFIGVSVPNATHGWTGAVIDYAQEALEAFGVDGRVVTADDVNKQSNDLEDLIAQGVDAVVILPIEGSPLTPAAQSVLDAGIPLVNFDRELDNQAYTALVRGDNSGIGTNGGAWLVDQLDGSGNVFMLSGPPVSVTTQRDDGFRSAIAGTDINVVGLQDGGYNREGGYSVMENALVANPQIDAVFAIDDEMALGALQAIKEAGRTDIRFLTGAGGNSEFFTTISEEDAIEMATFLYSPKMIQDAIEVAIQIVNGEDVPRVTTIPADRVGRENVDEFFVEGAPY
jgi:ribose transport system substrate-binding protein